MCKWRGSADGFARPDPHFQPVSLSRLCYGVSFAAVLCCALQICAVFAQLTVGGTWQGPHVFMVRLRDDKGAIMPGGAVCGWLAGFGVLRSRSGV